jgi:hypothetical protein
MYVFLQFFLRGVCSGKIFEGMLPKKFPKLVLGNIRFRIPDHVLEAGRRSCLEKVFEECQKSNFKKFFEAMLPKHSNVCIPTDFLRGYVLVKILEAMLPKNFSKLVFGKFSKFISRPCPRGRPALMSSF